MNAISFPSLAPDFVTFLTRAKATAARIPVVLVAISTAGYAAAYDGGGATYKRASGVPSTTGYFQSADGAYWELVEDAPHPLQFGAKGDGVTDDTAALTAWKSYGPRIGLRKGRFASQTLVFPTTVKEVRSTGEATFVPAAGAFASATTYKNEWANDGNGVLPASYATGDAVCFVLNGYTDQHAIPYTGKMYRCTAPHAPGTTNYPGAPGAPWVELPYTSFVVFANSSNVTLGRFGIDVSVNSYPHVAATNFYQCDNFSIPAGLYIPNGGTYGYWLDQCSDFLASSIYVGNYARHGFVQATSDRCRLTTCEAETPNVGIGHGFHFTLCIGGGAVACSSVGAGVFGFSIENSQFVICAAVNSKDSHREGANITDSAFCEINGGGIQWPDSGSRSNDYGASMNGANYACIVTGLIVRNAYKTGICVTGGALHCIIAGNQVSNCNTGNAANEGGIMLSGTTTQENRVSDNIITDDAGKHRFGVGEINAGNGAPSNNTINDNTVNGFTVADIIRSSPTTSIYGNNYDQTGRAFNSTVTAATGSVVGTATITWRYSGKFIEIMMIELALSSNSGDTALRLTVPITGIPNTGFIAGVDLATGQMLRGTLDNPGYLNIVKYDNFYPAGNVIARFAGGSYQAAA